MVIMAREAIGGSLAVEVIVQCDSGVIVIGDIFVKRMHHGDLGQHQQN